MKTELKTVILPPIFAKIYAEPDTTQYDPEIKKEAAAFIKENKLGTLVSIHHRQYGQVLGKFTTSPDITNPHTETRIFHTLIVEMAEEKVAFEVPLNVETIAENVLYYVSEKIERGKEEGMTEFGNNLAGYEFDWWTIDDRPLPVMHRIYVLQNEELISLWQKKGLQTDTTIECSAGALFTIDVTSKRELDVYEMAWKQSANECDFLIMCDFKGYTPMSVYTDRWWDSLNVNQRMMILGNHLPSQENELWQRLGVDRQLSLFNLLNETQPEDLSARVWEGLQLGKIEDMASDIADREMERKYDMPIYEMAEDGEDYYPFYESRRNKLIQAYEYGLKLFLGIGKVDQT